MDVKKSRFDSIRFGMMMWDMEKKGQVGSLNIRRRKRNGRGIMKSRRRKKEKGWVEIAVGGDRGHLLRNGRL